MEVPIAQVFVFQPSPGEPSELKQLPLRPLPLRHWPVEFVDTPLQRNNDTSDYSESQDKEYHLYPSC